MREAPTPAYISTKSEPLAKRNGTLASPAIERASSVLPVPGRPDEQHALRDAAADRREAARLAQEVDDLLHFFLRLVHAGDIREGDSRRLGIRLARLALERRDAAGRHAIHRERRAAPTKPRPSTSAP